MTAEAAIAERNLLLSPRDGLTSEPGISSRIGARRQLEARYGQVNRTLVRLGLSRSMPSKKKWRTL